MMRIRKRYSLVGAAALLVAGGCNNLDVTNPNNPDVARALASPDDVKSLAISTIHSWYMTTVSAGPDDNGDLYEFMQSVTADVNTGNFGNFGMRFNNLEPRIPYANSSAGGDRAQTETPWDYNYGTIGAANDVLRAIKGGLVITNADETEKYKQLAEFSQAASYTNLALTFDKAFVVTEDNDVLVNPPSLVPYAEVRDSAMRMWNTLIAASAGKTYVYGVTDLPSPNGALTSAKLNRLSNTLAAMLLAYTPRTPAQSASVDWVKVAALADKGIGTGSAGAPFDVVVSGDNQTWWSYIAGYGEEESWVRTDHRVINRMNSSVPPKFDGNIPPQGSSPDARYTTDFGYKAPPIGDPARGIYMQSVFYHKRYVGHARSSPTHFATPVPYMLAAESDLIRAEALIRSGGDLTAAAGLINTTRVGRGNLPPATAADGAAGLLSDISYERDIEILNTSGTTLYWRRAVTDQPLQTGTMCQLPMPAKELETLALPIYTFGGSNPCS